MKLDLVELLAHAEDAARLAGAHIAAARPRSIARKTGATSAASEVVTEVDRQAQALILEALAPTLDRYDLAVLTEEAPDDGRRLRADHFWCIDPLDGTLPFIEGVAGYAVSVALVSRSGAPLIGVVFDPESAVCYTAASGLGVHRDGAPWHEESAADSLSVFLDRSALDRPDHAQVLDALRRLAAELGLGEPKMHVGAGAVMNACGVLESPPALYLKRPKATLGGGSLWDFAATACLFAEAGAVATDLAGAPLDLNRSDSTYMNHRGVMYATSEAIAARARALLHN